MFDFLSKVKIGKQAMISLIKGGAFDKLEGRDRIEIMRDYILATCDHKSRLTLQNFSGLIASGLIPADLEFEVRVFNFNKFLKANCKLKEYYILPAPCEKFYKEFFDIDELIVIKNFPAIEQKTWDKMYKKVMDKAREWLKTNQESTLNDYNDLLFKQDWDKYCKGNISSWEMESLCFYHGAHELAKVNNSKYGLSNFSDLPENPEVDYYFKRAGKEIPIFKLHRIAGTVIGKNKIKNIVSLLTTDGVINVRFRAEMFAAFDKQISEKQEDGTKKVVEKSWFGRGTKIMLTGFRRGDQFVPKKYANTPTHTIYRIDEVTEDGDLSLRSERG